MNRELDNILKNECNMVEFLVTGNWSGRSVFGDIDLMYISFEETS